MDTEETANQKTDEAVFKVPRDPIEFEDIIFYHGEQRCTIQAPKELRQNRSILSEFLSLDTWKSLSKDLKDHLMTFLPEFGLDGEEEREEKEKCAKMLFTRTSMKFGVTPLEVFERNYFHGEYTVRKAFIYKLANEISDAIICDRKRARNYQMLEDVLLSRKKLLERETGAKLPIPKEVRALKDKSFYAMYSPDIDHRIASRYLNELNSIRRQLGKPETDRDEFFPAGPPPKRTRREYNLMNCEYWKSQEDSGRKIRKPKEAKQTKRKQSTAQSRILQNLKQKNKVNKYQSVLLKKSATRQNGFISRENKKFQSLLKRKSAVRTSECSFKPSSDFFSLIRDQFMHQMKKKLSIKFLEQLIRDWEENPGANECDWVRLHKSWKKQVIPALTYLSGSNMDQESFTPLIRCNFKAEECEWIGTGEESDCLKEMFWSWMQSKSSSKEKEDGKKLENVRKTKEEIPRVLPSSEEEKSNFRTQESQRYKDPTRSFTYQYKGMAVAVSGIKHPRVKTKPHPFLASERPASVNIVSIVRDAVARLPDGKGSRADIIELMKDSQFLIGNSIEKEGNSAFTNMVSGALDRLQNERDPCVKYLSKDKIWINLHKGRTAEDYDAVNIPDDIAVSHIKETTEFGDDFETVSSSPSLDHAYTSEKSVLNKFATTSTAATIASSLLPSRTEPSISSSSHDSTCQTIQIMTSSGLRTFRLSLPDNSDNPSRTSSFVEEMVLSQAPVSNDDPFTSRQSITSATSSSRAALGKLSETSAVPLSKSSHHFTPSLYDIIQPKINNKAAVSDSRTSESRWDFTKSILSSTSSCSSSASQYPTIPFKSVNISKPVTKISHAFQTTPSEGIPCLSSRNQSILPTPAFVSFGGTKLAYTPTSSSKIHSNLSQTPTSCNDLRHHKVIVKNAEGKSVQLTPEQVKKLYASGALISKTSSQATSNGNKISSSNSSSHLESAPLVVASYNHRSILSSRQSVLKPSNTTTSSLSHVRMVTSSQASGKSGNVIRLQYDTSARVNVSSQSKSNLHSVSASCFTGQQNQRSIVIAGTQAGQNMSNQTARVICTTQSPVQIPVQSTPLNGSFIIGQHVKLGDKRYAVALVSGQPVLTPVQNS